MITITKKQREQFNKMRKSLIKISKVYQTTSQLKRNSVKDFGLNWDEAIEMAYENIQGEALFACKGVREI